MKSALSNQSTWSSEANKSLDKAVADKPHSNCSTVPASGASTPSVGASGFPSPNAVTDAPHTGMSGPKVQPSVSLSHHDGFGLNVNTIPVSGQTNSPLIQPLIGKAAAQMISGSVQLRNLIAPSQIDELSGVEGLMPRFIRRMSAPAGHYVATDEVDAEMYDKGEKDILNVKDISTWLKAEKDETKDELWTRLADLARFSLCGFGKFDSSLAIGVYNKDRRTTLLRQGGTERERLWDLGARVPGGNRISNGVASLQRGSLPTENIPDEALLVSDFLPWSLDAYEKFQPVDKKMELRQKQWVGIGKFVKAGQLV